MKAKDIKTGELYDAKVNGELTTVYLTSESPYGGWYAINQATGREVQIRTGGRLRRKYVPTTIPTITSR